MTHLNAVDWAVILGPVAFMLAWTWIEIKGERHAEG